MVNTVNGWIKIKSHKVVRHCIICGKVIENPKENKLYCADCIKKYHIYKKKDEKKVAVVNSETN